ncbi:MAG: YqgE/AlgH family protein [Rhodocyclaceae bacterium]|nr:YqgE/AlgH family protein [Rhodocyclaceae bacterium]
MTTRRTALRHLLVLAGLPWLDPVLARPHDHGGSAQDTILLVASDKMGDPRFRETVLMVMRHGPGGPLGVILNRPTRFTREQILPRFEELPGGGEPVFLGGPVNHKTLFYIARFGTEPPGVLTIAPDVYMGLDLRALGRMLEAGMRPAALRIYAGYAGWAPGQLERELQQASWHVLPMDPGVLFEADTDALYPRLKTRTRLIPA